jgi:hypothetical protein
LAAAPFAAVAKALGTVTMVGLEVGIGLVPPAASNARTRYEFWVPRPTVESTKVAFCVVPINAAFR